MSMIALGWAWKQNLNLTSQKLLLVALADQARECGHVWPSVKTLSLRVGVGDRQVRKLISDLVDVEDLLGRTEQYRSDGARSVNLYLLPLESGIDCAVECRGSESYKPDDSRPVYPVPRGGKPPSHRTGASLEPKEEPKKVIKNPSVPTGWENIVTPDESFRWAVPLLELERRLVFKDPPKKEWLEGVIAAKPASWMRTETQKFVDYYNAPDTRKLKAWKTAFTTWINRAAERSPDLDNSETLHDPSLPKGECVCGMCRRRYAKK